MEPAIGLIEFNSIASGILATDAMAKKASVTVVDSRGICPGKYIVLVTGDVEAVQRALDAGIEAGAGAVTEKLLLPNIHPQVVPALIAATPVHELRALGVIETFNAPACIVAADAAAKETDIELVLIRVGNGLGGKSFVVITGEWADVEAAMAAGTERIKGMGALVRRIAIPNPHVDLNSFIL
ncbi:MAG: BMC domain-containing protein [Candidatus Aureabacteria bacterium]|nr:BMC domain-containing protein [Candidatus Auribacterota bacterium]